VGNRARQGFRGSRCPDVIQRIYASGLLERVPGNRAQAEQMAESEGFGLVATPGHLIKWVKDPDSWLVAYEKESGLCALAKRACACQGFRGLLPQPGVPWFWASLDPPWGAQGGAYGTACPGPTPRRMRCRNDSSLGSGSICRPVTGRSLSGPTGPQDVHGRVHVGVGLVTTRPAPELGLSSPVLPVEVPARRAPL